MMLQFGRKHRCCVDLRPSRWVHLRREAGPQKDPAEEDQPKPASPVTTWDALAFGLFPGCLTARPLLAKPWK